MQEPPSLEPDIATVFEEPVDSVYLSDSSERQVQHELITMRLYARAGRTRPALYAPAKCLQKIHIPSRFSKIAPAP
jgi:hypothetical protein